MIWQAVASYINEACGNVIRQENDTLVMYGRAQFDELSVRSFNSQTIDPNNGYCQFFMEN